ncbi:hypothetical protein HK101_005488 [Irineochytrium annulatum]|nr:hypothetical protein HK101_005488 [Irineochytrium annulatum]
MGMDLSVKIHHIASDLLKARLLGPGGPAMRAANDGAFILPEQIRLAEMPLAKAQLSSHVHTSTVTFASTTKSTAVKPTATKPTTSKSTAIKSTIKQTKSAKPIAAVSNKHVVTASDIASVGPNIGTVEARNIVAAAAGLKRRASVNYKEFSDDDAEWGSSTRHKRRRTSASSHHHTTYTATATSTHHAAPKKRTASFSSTSSSDPEWSHLSHAAAASYPTSPPSQTTPPPDAAPGSGVVVATASTGVPGCCQFCGVRKTGQWRRGPAGQRTLCNACGINWSKKCKALAQRTGCGLKEAERVIGCDQSKFRKVVVEGGAASGGERSSVGLGSSADEMEDEEESQDMMEE